MKNNPVISIADIELQPRPPACEYFTTGKFAVAAETPAGGDGKPGFFRFVGRAEQSGDYWEGE